MTLGEATPALSGGEAQRLKLAYEMETPLQGSVFVFDEPTIGLHPQDVKKLILIFDHLIQLGATVIVIEHDLELVTNCDYIIDMGRGEERKAVESLLKAHLKQWLQTRKTSPVDI